MRIKFLKVRLSSFQLVILGFWGVILIGTLLLMLPVSSISGIGASFENALFTATSAVCVTGLVVQDTATYWSYFGQAVILLLIQIGGLGVVGVTAFIATVAGKKITLFQRSMLQESYCAHQIGGIVRITGFIFRSVIIVELIGAAALMPTFCKEYGVKGIWMSVFHSISAFCNAGFDLMGDKTGPFTSLTYFAGNFGIVIPICLLIIVGGIGFMTWDDIAVHGSNFKRYRMQSKVVLVTTIILVLIPASILFFSDYSGYDYKERVFLSLFQAVTPRTAGFNTSDMASLSGLGRILIVSLMLIGGSPGSTAGGMKTTTVAVLAANAVAVFHRRKDARLFDRNIEASAIGTASTLMMMYVFLTIFGAAVISVSDNLPIGVCIFEAASAIGTVGLSMGITPSLGIVSHFMLIVLMFLGRVGGLTLLFAAIRRTGIEVSHYPVEKINVG